MPCAAGVSGPETVAFRELDLLRPLKMDIKYGHFMENGMRTVTATEFKARCLALLDEVNRTRTRLVVTRHGKPVAEIGPHTASAQSSDNPLKGSVLFEGDLVSPIAADWSNAP